MYKPKTVAVLEPGTVVYIRLAAGRGGSVSVLQSTIHMASARLVDDKVSVSYALYGHDYTVAESAIHLSAEEAFAAK